MNAYLIIANVWLAASVVLLAVDITGKYLLFLECAALSFLFIVLDLASKYSSNVTELEKIG